MGCGTYLFIDLTSRANAWRATDRHLRRQDLLLPGSNRDLGLLSLGARYLGPPRGFPELKACFPAHKAGVSKGSNMGQIANFPL